MNRFLERLKSNGPILLDGGLATELEKLGEDLSHPLWSGRVLIDSPERMIEVHRSFVDAGCEIITTATYQLSIPGLVKLGYEEGRAKRKLEELLAKSVELAKIAIDEKKLFIAGSMGPYGAYLADGSEFTGNYKLSRKELKDFHRPRVSFFENHEEVDILAFETIPSLDEALAITELLEELNTQTPAWISFSCKSGEETCSGDLVSNCAKEISKSSHIHVIGVNCTQPEFVSSILEKMHKSCALPLIAYPNSGELWDPKSRSWVGSVNKDLPNSSKAWVEKGAKIIGGCCRVGPSVCKSLVSN